MQQPLDTKQSKMTSTPSNKTQLKILQINLNKSHEAQLDLLHAACKDYDIIAIQEPWISSSGNTAAGQHWRVFYPSTKLLDRYKDKPT
ncbi:hypothetical protein FRC18_010345 [Serendipita sp. 400]|nr:hypothetical protein FRC18_010345 [Serendipita sp. 400]